MSAPYAHVVFDWDGTLSDTLHAKSRLAAGVLSDLLGLPADALAAAYLRHSGVPRRTLFDRIASEVAARTLSEDEFTRASAAFTSANLAALGGAPLQPGVDATLRELHRRGVRLAVSSSAPPEDLDPRVQRSGLGPLFDRTLGSGASLSKGPEHIAALQGTWGVSAAAILVVGDEAADVALARAAGAKIALVLHTLDESEARAAAPDHVLLRFTDLLPLCPGP